MFADDEGKGQVFPIKQRQNDKSPTHYGELILFGHRVRIKGWVNTARHGGKYLRLELDDRGLAPSKPAI